MDRLRTQDLLMKLIWVEKFPGILTTPTPKREA